MARSGKKRGGQAFSAKTPHSAPFREMATCGLALEENRDFCNLERDMARCGYTGVWLFRGPVRLSLHVSEESRLEFDLAQEQFAPPANLRIQASAMPVTGGSSSLVNGGGSNPAVSPPHADGTPDSGLGI